MKTPDKRKTSEQPVAKKKMKQMTLLEILKMSPMVVITPLRVPLEAIQPTSFLTDKKLHLPVKNGTVKKVESKTKSKSGTPKKEITTRSSSSDDIVVIKEIINNLEVNSKSKVSQQSNSCSKKKSVKSSKQREKKSLKVAPNGATIKDKLKAAEVKTVEPDKEKTKTVVNSKESPKYKGLPQPTLVTLPFGLKNEHYGDILLVTEFIISYRAALNIPPKLRLSSNSIITALSKGSEWHDFINQIVLCLVDVIAKDVDPKLELGVKLCDLPLTCFLSSEVVRLCIIYYSGYKKKTDLPELLNSKEFLFLPANRILEMLTYLCEAAQLSTIILNYVEEKRETLRQLYVSKCGIRNLETEATEKMLQLRGLEDQKKEQTLSASNSLSPSSFYGSAFVDALEDVSPENLPRGVQRRVMAEKLRTEKAKADLEKQEKIKLQADIQKLEENISNILVQHKQVNNEVKDMKRSVPVGTDRDNTRYWWFNHAVPRLVLEKNSAYNLNSKDNELDSISKWFIYKSPNDMEKFLYSLSVFDQKELELKIALKKLLATCAEWYKQNEEEEDLISDSNWSETSVEALKNDMEKAVVAITTKSLGWMADVDAWLLELEKAERLPQLKTFLIDICRCLRQTSQEDRENKEDKFKTWIAAVQDCETLSRLHFLLAVFNVHVDWDNASLRKCRLCRRTNTKYIISCNDCKLNFHLDCLQPSVSDMPDMGWHCPSCEKKNAEVSNEDYDDSDECSLEEESCIKCCECYSSSGIIMQCNICDAYCHSVCSYPKLRCHPKSKREVWVCNECNESSQAPKTSNTKKKIGRKVTSLRRSQRFR
ncbi:hypothetical protein CHUAL_004572 [Chamberlinius hualienensis]